MSDSWKAHEGGTFFLTFAVVGWIDLFTRRAYAEFLLHNLAICQRNKGLLLYAYVIMPSHVHLIAGAKGGLVTYILRDFKTYTSKELVDGGGEPGRKPEGMAAAVVPPVRPAEPIKHQQPGLGACAIAGYGDGAQPTNHPIELYSDGVYQQKLEYMMNNPVRDGFCTTPESYTWSSANPEQGLTLEDWYAEV